MFTDPDGRHALASGTFLGDGNDYALSVNVAIPFCLFLMLEARNSLTKRSTAVRCCILVLCVVATKSRGGTMALVCVGIYYWLKSDRRSLLGSLTAAALSMVLVLAPPSYFERMNTISTPRGRLRAGPPGRRGAVRCANGDRQSAGRGRCRPVSGEVQHRATARRDGGCGLPRTRSTS